MDIEKLTQSEPIEFGDSRKAQRLDQLKLDTNDHRIVQSLSNIVTILDGLSEWSGVFAFNELTEQYIVTRPLPGSRGNPKLHRPRPLRDEDVGHVRVWLNRRLKWAKVIKSDVFDAIALAAREHKISPIHHYLQGLQKQSAQDACKYLASVVETHFGLYKWNEHPDTLRYSELVFQKWLISAVARAIEPGCKADHVLILEGPQGVGKSTAVRTLCGDEYFGDTVPRLDTKDASDYVRGKWIIELAELSSVSKSAVEQVKAYITRTEEKFRPAYGRNEVIYQRRCIFVGTTNRMDYLRDETGNRRFWPIKLDTVDIDAIRSDRDKIWTAAKALYDAGERWWLTSAEESLAKNQQLQRASVDPLFDEVAEWLETSGKSETCMREALAAVASDDEDTSAVKMSPQLQHRLRGALNAAGFKSTGLKFTSGDHKGRTIFALPLPEPKLRF